MCEQGCSLIWRFKIDVVSSAVCKKYLWHLQCLNWMLGNILCCSVLYFWHCTARQIIPVSVWRVNLSLSPMQAVTLWPVSALTLAAFIPTAEFTASRLSFTPSLCHNPQDLKFVCTMLLLVHTSGLTCFYTSMFSLICAVHFFKQSNSFYNYYYDFKRFLC